MLNIGGTHHISEVMKMVAIKDFGMPSCCAECNLEFVHDDVLGCCVYQGFDDENKERYDKRLPNCPLIEIEQSEDCVSRMEVLKIVSRFWLDKKIDDKVFHQITDCFNAMPYVLPKLPASDDCVSRTQAIEWIENLRQMDKCFGNYEDDYFPLSEVIDRLKNVPPVTPTHGTCKDCKYCEDIGIKGTFYCKRYGINHLDKYYCADFEKRGNENGSN